MCMSSRIVVIEMEKLRSCFDAKGNFIFFFSSRRRHTRFDCDWSSDVCSSDLTAAPRRCRCGARTRSASSRGPRVRSEERRVGKEWRTRWWTTPAKKKSQNGSPLISNGGLEKANEEVYRDSTPIEELL